MNDLSGKMRSSMPDIGAYEFDGVSSFSLGIDTTICSNGTIDLGDAASDASWMWNTGDTTNVITVAGSPGGTYIATRMSSCGTAVDTVVVTPAPTPVAAFDTTFTSFATVVFNNMSTDADTYMWDFGDGNTSTDENPTHIYTTGGVYTVTLIANGPCGADTTTYVLNLEITALDELSASIDMYPNPANDVLTINADQVLDASIEVYNVSGKLVLSENIQGTTKTINVTNLAKGMYMIKITNNEGSSIQRLIVE
jgi:PKD repeat protein